MAFEPRGFFKSTRVKEYESYCRGVQDAMEAAMHPAAFNKGDTHLIWPVLPFRNEMLNLIVEAADDFTD